MYNFEQQTPLKNSFTEMHAVFKAIEAAYQINHTERLDNGFRFGHNPICENFVTANERQGAVLDLRAEFVKMTDVAGVKRDVWEITDYDKEYEARCKEMSATFKTALAKKWSVQEDCFEVEVSSGYSMKTHITEYRVKFKLDDLSNNQDKQNAIKGALATIVALKPRPADRHYNF